MIRILLIVIVVAMSLPIPATGAVAPNEVILFEHVDFMGNNPLRFKLEPWMRHKLVKNLDSFWNDRISSIAVGTDVKVLVFADGKLCGQNKVFDRDVAQLGDFNDRISSLIIFPKKLAHPQGVDLLIPKKSGWASAGKEMSFYPLPEPASSSEARYAAIGDYWNDKAVAIRLYGPIEVVLYKHVHFQDPSMKFPGMLGAKDYYILKDYQFDKVTSSLIVRTRATAQSPSPPAMQPLKPLQPAEKPVQPLKPIQPPISLINKIQGKWFSNIGVVYHIKQNGNNFTWLAKGGKEVGHGSISGSNLSATWQGPGGSGQATGKVKQMQGNQATRIEWNNGVVFKR